MTALLAFIGGGMLVLAVFAVVGVIRDASPPPASPPEHVPSAFERGSIEHITLDDLPPHIVRAILARD